MLMFDRRAGGTKLAHIEMGALRPLKMCVH